MQRLNIAAVTVQSIYRGYTCRMRLKKASSAIAKFQRIYRQQKKNREDEIDKEKMEKMKSDYVESKRRKTFVNSKSKQLKVTVFLFT